MVVTLTDKEGSTMRKMEKSKKHKIPFKAKKMNIEGAFTIARPPKETPK
jgi:hypothetical protein